MSRQVFSDFVLTPKIDASASKSNVACRLLKAAECLATAAKTETAPLANKSTSRGLTVAMCPDFTGVYDFQYFNEASGTPVKASQSVAQRIKKWANIDSLNGLEMVWKAKE